MGGLTCNKYSEVYFNANVRRKIEILGLSVYVGVRTANFDLEMSKYIVIFLVEASYITVKTTKYSLIFC